MVGLKILVTGSNGYLGTSICKFLKSRNNIIFSLKRKQIDEIINTEDFKHSNFTNFDSFSILNNKYDFLIHAAAIPYFQCEKEASKAYLINTKFTDFLAAYCQLNNIYFLFLSTVQVYGNNLIGEYNENSTINPDTIYSISKRKAELAIIKRVKNNYLKSNILRIGNIVGKPLDNDSSGWNLFANRIILDSIKTKKIIILNNPNLRRNFISLDLLLNFINIIVNNVRRKNFFEPYLINLTSGNSLTLMEFALLVKKYNRSIRNDIVDLEYNKDLLMEVPYSVINNDILKKLMPELDIFCIEEAIKRMIFSFG